MDEPQVRVERAVAVAVRRHAMWTPGACVVVAVSGGADSLCLVGALLALRAQGAACAPGEIVVAHLDHGLRGVEGREDAAGVEAFAREQGVRFVGAAVDVAAIAKQAHRSLEDAARNARYAFLRRVAAEIGAERICVGHTRDDQAETVLLHFLRGAGLGGLAGMAPLTGNIARPLLDLTHADTCAYCVARDWQPSEDRSNEDMRFLRNRVRRELLPILEGYNPSLRETLARNAPLIGADDRYLDDLTAALYEDGPIVRGDQTVRLPLAWLREQPLALRRRLMRLVVTELAGDEDSLEARHSAQLDALLDGGRTGKSLNLPAGVRAILDYDALTMTRYPANTQQSATLHEYPLPAPGCVEATEIGWRVCAWLVETPPGLESVALPGLPPIGQAGTPADLGRAESRVYLDADIAGDNLLVRAWRPGDRFRPLGMAHEKKLQDYFADAKVPRALRSRIPLVCNRSQLLWIGGQRIDDRARLTPATRRVLALQIEPLERPAAESSPSSSVEPAQQPGKDRAAHDHLGESA
ncbi:MAG TPA: tRNA lysidine(34) synthetase TilS [Ktedonobacterales bacterium]|nr:tRNA lysidine(34) synthetase TilS [Ktedonobacterales bacterium]